MSRLRVAIPRELLDADSGTGAGRVWRAVLKRLPACGIQLDPQRSGRRGRLPGRRPDAWLLPGDAGVPAVDAPTVAVVQGAAWPIEPEFFDYVPRAYAELLIAATERTLDSATQVIVPSDYTRRGLVQGYGLHADRIHVVPHGVDLDTFEAGGSAQGQAMVAEALGEQRPYVLFASIPTIGQKNLPALKEAMRRLAVRGLPHALVIAGGPAGGERPDEVGRVTADLPGFPGRVAWLGHLDDHRLAALMAGCAAFCLPSLFESFGLTALEALACQAPTVVSARGALPEVVGDAALIDEPTAERLESSLAQLLSDDRLRDRLRAAGRRRAQELTWERTAKGWSRVLRLAAQRR